MAQRFATWIAATRANRFARIDSEENPYFHNVRPVRANRLKPAIRNFEPPRSAIRTKGVQIANPFFWNSLFFFPCKDFLVFSSIFPFFFSVILGVRLGYKILFFSVVFLAFFKKTRKGRTGPETIRENQAIRANLRIDSRESGHLSSKPFQGPRQSSGCNRWVEQTDPEASPAKMLLSSRNKLPFMILDPPEQSAENCSFREKNALSYSKMHFPTEK